MKTKREEKMKKSKKEDIQQEAESGGAAPEVSGSGMEVETLSPNEERRQEAAAG